MKLWNIKLMEGKYEKREDHEHIELRSTGKYSH